MSSVEIYYKHAKTEDQDAIRSLGRKAQSHFDAAVNQVARDVPS